MAKTSSQYARPLAAEGSLAQTRFGRAAARPFLSTAIFPADLGLDGRNAFDRPRPPRPPVPDVVRSEKLPGGVLITETALEAAAFRLLACDPSVERVLPRCHVLSYVARDADGRETRGRIVPDALVVRRDGGLDAIRLRPSWETAGDSAGRDADERNVRAAYRRHGIRYRPWTEVRPFARVPRQNRERMLRERSGLGAPGLDNVRRTLGRPDFPPTVGAVRRRARLGDVDEVLSCLFELALIGEVELDLRRPFDARTTVRRRSIP